MKWNSPIEWFADSVPKSNLFQQPNLAYVVQNPYVALDLRTGRVVKAAEIKWSCPERTQKSIIKWIKQLQKRNKLEFSRIRHHTLCTGVFPVIRFRLESGELIYYYYYYYRCFYDRWKFLLFSSYSFLRGSSRNDVLIRSSMHRCCDNNQTSLVTLCGQTSVAFKLFKNIIG